MGGEKGRVAGGRQRCSATAAGCAEKHVCVFSPSPLICNTLSPLCKSRHDDCIVICGTVRHASLPPLIPQLMIAAGPTEFHLTFWMPCIH